MITALFVRKDSIYKQLGIDCYDIARDSYNFKGNNVIIAHPPCRLWGRLRKLSTAPSCERITAYFAIECIRKNGGILEHPESSILFKSILPKPGSIDSFGGFTIKVNLHDFGFKAKKPTYLYVCGIEKRNLPSTPLNFNAITHCISSSQPSSRRKSNLLELNKMHFDKTPLLMAEWLIKVAKMIELNKNKI